MHQELRGALEDWQNYKGPEADAASPEPIYDSTGKRLNTRELRIKQSFRKEQQELIAKSMELQVCCLLFQCGLCAFFVLCFVCQRK